IRGGGAIPEDRTGCCEASGSATVRWVVRHGELTSRRYGLEIAFCACRPHPCALHGLLRRDGAKCDQIPRPVLDKGIQLAVEDGGDLGVAARGLMIGKENGCHTGTVDLDRTTQNCFGRHVERSAWRQAWPLQTHPHPVVGIRDAEWSLEERRNRLGGEEPV